VGSFSVCETGAVLSSDEVKESERVGVGFFCIFVLFLSFTVVAFVFFVVDVDEAVDGVEEEEEEEEGAGRRGVDEGESVFVVFVRGFFVIVEGGGLS